MEPEDAFYDAVYETWRRGGNPDNVSRDNIYHDISRGYEPEEARDYEIERCTKKKEKENVDSSSS